MRLGAVTFHRYLGSEEDEEDEIILDKILNKLECVLSLITSPLIQT